MDEQNDWSITGIWNKSLEEPEVRVYEPRDYLWASELGKLETDVFLGMAGTVPTNPPNFRSLRKFEAGNLWEWIIQVILIRAGIMQSSQERVYHQYDGLLKVSGKIDFIAGGHPDFETGEKMVREMNLPPKTSLAISNTLKYLKETYPQGLRTKALEVKSVSSFAMNAMEVTKKPFESHALQAYHYTKHEAIDRTDLVYICRDDCRMMEFAILADMPSWEEKYYNRIKQLTENHNSGIMPPKAKEIIFDDTLGKFSINRLIGWSPYLKMVYGFEDQMEFEDKYSSLPAGWNRVLKRIKVRENREHWLTSKGLTEADIEKKKIAGVEGKRGSTIQVVSYEGNEIQLPDDIKSGFDMTEKNLESIKQMEDYGFNAEECAKNLVDTGEEEDSVETG